MLILWIIGGIVVVAALSSLRNQRRATLAAEATALAIGALYGTLSDEARDRADKYLKGLKR